jgi:hypothetical protein
VLCEAWRAGVSAAGRCGGGERGGELVAGCEQWRGVGLQAREQCGCERLAAGALEGG